MAALLVVFFPVGLLLFLLFMERVEAPLRRADDPEEMERFLESAKQEDVDNIISGGLRKAMKVWRRRLTGRRRRTGSDPIEASVSQRED
ncbi:hypothetical protein [Epidermidibacterium keratini]|uniref:hypothetical protein n=1 Tax=Epidermidibacterium keratini TaxID=1891644 RepID=UPI0018658C5F|nr:hypothetical protein [Epidermidibacterium keratini]